MARDGGGVLVAAAGDLDAAGVDVGARGDDGSAVVGRVLPMALFEQNVRHDGVVLGGFPRLGHPRPAARTTEPEIGTSSRGPWGRIIEKLLRADI